MCKEEKHIFYNKTWYSLLLRHLLTQRHTAPEEVSDKQSKPKRRLGKKACMGHRFMAVPKWKTQHILKLSTLKLNYKKKTIQD